MKETIHTITTLIPSKVALAAADNLFVTSIPDQFANSVKITYAAITQLKPADAYVYKYHRRESSIFLDVPDVKGSFTILKIGSNMATKIKPQPPSQLTPKEAVCTKTRLREISSVIWKRALKIQPMMTRTAPNTGLGADVCYSLKKTVDAVMVKAPITRINKPIPCGRSNFYR